MTKTELYNLIKKTCPIGEATSIIDHCKQHKYNEARILVDGLQDELSEILGDTLDNVAFNIGLQRLYSYQAIWGELVHNLELPVHD